jgi:hypothetical protein
VTEARQQTPVERWLSIAGSVAAPVATVSAVLFYFGYVSSRAQYDYFGLDIDTVGLSTQAYVMRSPQPLLVPLLVLVVLGAVLSAAHRAVRRRIRADGDLLRAVRVGVRAGMTIMVAGFLLLFAYPVVGSWPLYPLVTPVVIGVGAALTAYCLQTRRWAGGLSHRPAESTAVADDAGTGAGAVGDGGGTGTAPPAAPGAPTALGAPTAPGAPTALGAAATPGGADPGASYVVLLWVTVGACAFWATATIAQWSGLGLAKQQAQHLTRLPSVILDTKEPLALPSGTSVRSRALVRTGSASDGPAGSGSPGGGASGSDASTGQFRYQYSHLRLLIQGGGRLFLVPDTWSNRDTTLVVPLDSSVRVQFQFRNDPP